ncbi:MAG: TetR/AcrR family transcriptional regulator [Cyanobacteria bacterium P01_A01_bin.3]
MVSPVTGTKEQIISVAERLFAERGFAGTTLRSVVNEAEVNLAAVHYHFGSKEELFRSVIERLARPIVEKELELLAQLQAGPHPPSVEAILTALLQPCLEVLTRDSDSQFIRAQFMGRCRTEPEPIQSMADREFAEVTDAFLDVLQRILPEQSRLQLQWKFDLVIMTLIRVLAEAGKPHAVLKGNKPEDIRAATEQLVKFLGPGMRS